ncbi:hypothetical protein [Actinomadura sp. 3N508]
MDQEECGLCGEPIKPGSTEAGEEASQYIKGGESITAHDQCAVDEGLKQS